MGKSKFLLLGLAMAALAACNNATTADQATITEKKETANETGKQLAIDNANSSVRFTGYGVGKSHPGNFRLSDGNIHVNENRLTGGNFTIDITSMQVEEEGDMFQNKLKPHLLSADFFDVEKYPTAKFEITEVKPFSPTGNDTSVVAGANYLVSGNFTLKEETKNISFPAKIEMSENGLKAAANFNIDRTQWNMRWGNDKSLGDKFISENVNIQLNLVANP